MEKEVDDCHKAMLERLKRLNYIVVVLLTSALSIIRQL